MPAPVHRRSPGSTRLPIPHPAPAVGSAAAESRDLPASALCDPDAPATLPYGPAHPAAAPRASTLGFRFRSIAGRVPRVVLRGPATTLRADAAAGTLAGAVRRSRATAPPPRLTPQC